MYLYKITQKEYLGKYGSDIESVIIAHSEEYDQHEFDELLRGIRHDLRMNHRYVEIDYLVNKLIEHGFRRVGFKAEDEFVLENYW